METKISNEEIMDEIISIEPNHELKDFNYYKEILRRD